MTERVFYSPKEVAEKAGISLDTLKRWLRDGKIPEPDRDRNGYRIFTQAELDHIVGHAQRIIPSPSRSQLPLSLQEKP